MKKYLLLGLTILVVALIGLIFLMTNMEKSNSNNVLSFVPAFSDVLPAQFSQALNSGQYQLIDVRTVEEYSARHLAKAEESDFYQTAAFSKFLDSLDKNGKYLIYCRTGIRSGKAMDLMLQKNFKTVYDLAGGYNAWLAAGLPVKQ